MKKILLSTVISVCLAFIFLPQSAYAAGFVQDTAGVKYQNDDGSFLKDSWVQVGQSIYHLDKNGLVQTGWIQVGSLWYLMDQTGACTNPTGTATAPAGQALGSTTAAASGDPFADAGWIALDTTDQTALADGISAGLVGFDGAQYWAEPTYAAALAASGIAAAGSVAQTGSALQTPAASTPAAASDVWLPATGSKYHRINNCGKMNPKKATKVSLQEAKDRGYTACSKCF